MIEYAIHLTVTFTLTTHDPLIFFLGVFDDCVNFHMIRRNIIDFFTCTLQEVIKEEACDKKDEKIFACIFR